MRSRFDIYCDILLWALLNIRNHADDRDRCFAESDHVHNIPELLRNFDDERLHQYYWEVERPCFLEKAKPEWLSRFRELWEELEAASRR
jgi:hypothetical protein